MNESNKDKILNESNHCLLEEEYRAQLKDDLPKGQRDERVEDLIIAWRNKGKKRLQSVG